MKRYCTFCSTKLAERLLSVNDPSGVSGHFCGAECYEKARAGTPALPLAVRHGDADTLMPVEPIWPTPHRTQY